MKWLRASAKKGAICTMPWRSEAPSAVADYNLYLQDNALYYAKQPCAPADTEAKFFLHIYPTNAADLPTYGGALENLDFDFINYGFLTDR